jgi:hypothetical protein
MPYATPFYRTHALRSAVAVHPPGNRARLSLALWLVVGGSLVGASRLPGSVDRLAKPASGGPALANDAGDETPYGFALQEPCDIIVTNSGDSGPGTLRQAIADVCDGGRITFDSNYTIYLTTTLEITRQLTVDGETHAVTVSGDSGGDGTPNVLKGYTSASKKHLTNPQIHDMLAIEPMFYGQGARAAARAQEGHFHEYPLLPACSHPGAFYLKISTNLKG